MSDTMTPPVAQDPNPLSLGNVGHFLGNAVNAAAFNAGDLIPGVKDWREDPRYKTASDWGGGTGLVGSMFIPGGILAKGLGKGLQAAGAANTGAKLLKVGEFMNGAGKTDALTNLGRGALLGAEQAVPRAAIAMTPQGGGESPQDALAQSALGTGLGGGLGVVGGAIGKGIGKLVGKDTLEPGGLLERDLSGKIREDAGNQYLASHFDTSARAFREWADNIPGVGPTGKINSLDDGKQNFIDFTVKHGLLNNDNVKDYHAALGEVFDHGKNAFEDSGEQFIKPGSVAMKAENGAETAATMPQPPDWLQNYPGFRKLQNMLIPFVSKEGAESKLADTLSGLQKQFDDAKLAGFNGTDAVMNTLGKIERSNIPGASTNDKVEGMIAGTIKDALQEHGFDLAKDVPEAQSLIQQLGLSSVKDAKEAYRTLGPWRYNERLQTSKTEPIVTPGSDTAMKNAMMQGFGNMGGIGAGAAIGGAGTGFDFSNPATVPAIIGGGIAGNMLGKGIGGLVNKGLGQAGLKVNQALAPGSDAAQKIENIQNIARGNTPVQQGLAQPTQNLQGLPGRAIQGAPAPAMVGQAPPPAGPVQPGQVPQGGPAQGQQGPASADMGLSQSALPPGLLGPDKQTYENTVNGVIDRLYRQIFFASGNTPMIQGMPTKQEFAQDIAKASNNFDPKMMAKLLIPSGQKDQEDFLRSYQKLENINKVNIQSDLIGKALPVLGGIMDPAAYKIKLQSLATAMTQPEQGGAIDPKKTGQIFNQLDDIIKGWGSPAQKEGLIRQMIQANVGPTVNNLQQFGLLDGTVLGG